MKNFVSLVAKISITLLFMTVGLKTFVSAQQIWVGELNQNNVCKEATVDSSIGTIKLQILNDSAIYGRIEFNALKILNESVYRKYVLYGYMEGNLFRGKGINHFANSRPHLGSVILKLNKQDQILSGSWQLTGNYLFGIPRAKGCATAQLEEDTEVSSLKSSYLNQD